jgi:hypothetical protein
MSPVKYELGFYIPEDDCLHRSNEILTDDFISIHLQISCTRAFLSPVRVGSSHANYHNIYRLSDMAH